MRYGIKRLVHGVLLALLVIVLQACVSAGLSSDKAKKAAQINAELGANYLRRNELEQARDKLEKALAQDNKNALAHVAYGQLQHRVDNPEKARTHFKKAIQLEPEEAEHRNNYGVFLCQIDEIDEAEKQFLVAAGDAYYDTPEFALDNAGVCMLDANRLDKAEQYLRDALRTNPKFANTYLHMAELLYQRNRLTVADAYFQQFMSRGNDTPESLLLGIQIQRDAGNPNVAEQYANKLLNDFPTSREAGEYLSRPLQ